MEKNKEVVQAEMCCICYEELKEGLMSLPCKHVLHTVCGLKWLRSKNTCPMCRKEPVKEEEKKEESEEESDSEQEEKEEKEEKEEVIVYQRRRRRNIGFRQKIKISPELANFCNWNVGSLHSRVEVTKHICDYIREHNLQNPEDRRQIFLDRPLKELFNCDKEYVTYYSLQTYIKPHYVEN